MFPTLLAWSVWGLLVLRLTVGFVFLAHGWGKLKSPKAMAQGLGWGTATVAFLGFIETASALLLIFGFLTQLAAILLGLVMIGAIYYKIVKWHKTFTGDGGWELDLALLGSNVALIVGGASVWALDRVVF